MPQALPAKAVAKVAVAESLPLKIRKKLLRDFADRDAEVIACV